MVPTLRSGVSLLAVALLMIGGSPVMPVVCFAHAHAEVELLFSGCCAHEGAPAGHTGVSLESSVRNCGNCTDVPLISAAVPQPTMNAVVDQTVCIIADSLPVAFADAGFPQSTGGSLLPPASPTIPVSLRC